jgi:hypothetical protein
MTRLRLPSQSSDQLRPSQPSAPGLALQLGAARTVLGSLVLVAPVPAARLLGADTATARRVSWLSRMVGVRDAAIGVGTVVTARGGDPRGWLVAGAVSDLVDAAVLARARRQGRVGGASSVVVPGAALAAATGFAAAGSLTRIRRRG